MIDLAGQKKLTQHCKSIILQILIILFQVKKENKSLDNVCKWQVKHHSACQVKCVLRTAAVCIDKMKKKKKKKNQLKMKS